MARKHFKEIAEGIKAMNLTPIETIILARALSRTFIKINVKFDAERFMAACKGELQS